MQRSTFFLSRDTRSYLMLFGAMAFMIMIIGAMGSNDTANARAYASAQHLMQQTTVAELSAYARAHGYHEVALAADEPPVFIKANGHKALQPQVTGRGSSLIMHRSRTLPRFPTVDGTDLALLGSKITEGACHPAPGNLPGVQVCRSGAASAGLVIKVAATN